MAVEAGMEAEAGAVAGMEVGVAAIGDRDLVSVFTPGILMVITRHIMATRPTRIILITPPIRQLLRQHRPISLRRFLAMLLPLRRQRITCRLNLIGRPARA
jgi:hypothetical protein